MQEEVSLQRPFDSRLTRRLLRLVLPWWPWVLVALACLLVNSVLQILSPLLTKIAIDRYLAPAPQSTLPWLEQRLPSEPIAGIAGVSLLYFGILAAGLRNERAPRDVAVHAVESAGAHAAHELSRYLTLLGSIGSVAPLLG
ncbi:MAG: hypothetical protein WHT08_18660, partial [Bryobacteraceae bacterium]